MLELKTTTLLEEGSNVMKIIVLSMGYSSYWTSCWRELYKRPGVELQVFTPETKYSYSEDMLKGLPIGILRKKEFSNSKSVCDMVVAAKPDVIFVGGWSSVAFNAVAKDFRLKRVKKILMIDGAWKGSFKQILQRFRLGYLIRKYSGIIVGGERGRQYARWLGFSADKIFTSIYGYDADAYKHCYELRKDKWPKSFCYVGRYAKIKGLDSLLDAYEIYREYFGDAAWALNCYGGGPLKERMSKYKGVVDYGFLQPKDLPRALAAEGVFVFPSLHEPWGVALVEAAGSGLPIVCSDQVASGVELVKPEFNGIVYPAGSVERLAMALIRMHKNYSKLSIWGDRSRVMAEAFSPKIWCDRWMEVIKCI